MANKRSKIQAIKGMKDILPDDSPIWQHIEQTAREVFGRYNYDEIRVPILEKTELFSRSIGDTTDIVEKEMFTFKDRNEESITLRPEGTAPVVRSFIENNLSGTPLKLFYIGPMFRYEKPQKGRQRQFHQLGAEVLGLDDPLIDVELIRMCADLLQALDVDDFDIQINSLGSDASRERFKKTLVKYLDQNSGKLCKNCLTRKERNPLRVFDCKEKGCRDAIKQAPVITDCLDEQSKANFASVQEGLKAAHLAFEVNPAMVRGLDYYTNVVFEFTCKRLGAQNSILGGGRYNKLVEELGGKPTPASGFALGIERLFLLIRESLNLPVKKLVYISALGSQARLRAFQFSLKLRDAGIRAEPDISGRSLKSQLGRADKSGACLTVIIGENEIDKDAYIVRDMKSKEQRSAKWKELPDLVKSLI